MVVRRLFLSLLLIGVAFGQVDYPAVIQSEGVDFGGVSGTWGHLQYHRPFGMRGIIMNDWKDLTVLNPINGEVTNTDQRGWRNRDSVNSYYDRIHPTLVTTQDTIAPSLLVNYKQGDGDFSDFSAWYHNSLGRFTRYGWTSKLRSHQRFLDVTGYYDQRHRLFIEHELSTKVVKIELNYDQHVNPMYLFELDTSTQVEAYRDDYTLHSDRWGGSVEVVSNDSASSASELFVWVEGGKWKWGVRQRNSLRSLAYYGRDLQLGSLPTLKFKLGFISNGLGGYRSSRQFVDLTVPLEFGSRLALDIGLRNIGSSDWLPILKTQIDLGIIGLEYRIHHQIYNKIWEPEFSATSVHHISTQLDLGWLDPYGGAWVGESDGAQGYYTGVNVSLPWQLSLNVEGSQVSKGSDWVWSGKQVKWEMGKQFTLFKKALYGDLRLWGRHLLEPEQGDLDPNSFVVSTIPADGIAHPPVHLLNYTISAQISKLVLAYTGGNLLQDETWASITDVTWETEFSLMKNQLPNNRFRYLSLIWTFDN